MTALQKLGQNVDEHTGIYQAPILGDLVNAVWYSSSTADGVVINEYDPFPIVGFALVLTAVCFELVVRVI